MAPAGEHGGNARCAPKAQTPIHAQVPYCTIFQSRLESRHHLSAAWWRTEGANRSPGGMAVNLSGTKDRGSGSLADMRQLLAIDLVAATAHPSGADPL